MTSLCASSPAFFCTEIDTPYAFHSTLSEASGPVTMCQLGNEPSPVLLARVPSADWARRWICVDGHELDVRGLGAQVRIRLLDLSRHDRTDVVTGRVEEREHHHVGRLGRHGDRVVVLIGEGERGAGRGVTALSPMNEPNDVLMEPAGVGTEGVATGTVVVGGCGVVGTGLSPAAENRCSPIRPPGSGRGPPRGPSRRI